MDRVFLEATLLAKHGFVHGFSVKGAQEPTALDLPRGLDGLDPGRVFQANQVHGANVALAAGDPGVVRKTDADALVARTPGAAVAVRVADCVPVLVGARNGGAVSAIHAGWRGVVRGVLQAALAELRRSEASDFIAAIGPCIGPCCFEVGADVAEEIARASGADAITRREGEKAYVDLRRAVRAILEREGVREIEDVPGCTKHEPARFYSYRRDGANAGRQIGVIAARVSGAVPTGT